MKQIMEIILLLCLAAAAAAGVFLFLIAPGKPVFPRDEWFLGRNFAHRGLYTSDQSIPENSMAAFANAVRAGYAIEMDVELSSDSVPVVFHDDTLLRMTGRPGRLGDLPYRELKNLKLAGSGESIPRFEDILRLVDGKVPLLIELKSTRRIGVVCRKTYGLLREYKGLYCIESFNPLILAWFRSHAPEVLRGQLSKRHSGKDGISRFTGFLLENLMFNFISRPQFIAYRWQDADKFPLRLCRRMGAFTAAWTVDSEKARRAAGKKFDGMIFEHIRPARSFQR